MKLMCLRNSESFTALAWVPPKSDPEARIWEAQMSNGEDGMEKGEKPKKTNQKKKKMDVLMNNLLFR